MTLLVDYSKTVPKPAAIKAAGYSGAVRYLSNDPGKNLTPAERDGLHAAGLSITLVWETTAKRASEGSAAGIDDCHTAESQARRLGYPIGCPIFYAVDFDTPPGAVLRYFSGVQGRATYPVGVYGSARVIEGVSAAPWKWQAAAWSAGRVSPLAHLYQRVSATVVRPLAGTDENVILKSFPLWSAPTKETDMPLTQADADLIVHTLLLTNLGRSGPSVSVALQQGAAVPRPVDVAGIAAAVAAAMPAPSLGSSLAPISQAALEAALRTVLGSVDA